ncbi:MAG: DUF2330 domain-containing protein, partial [Deltaproteobacteria bacterium]|nr:DUF2330 domain-containing protein [Deltaproteobacteria bacterium]
DEHDYDLPEASIPLLQDYVDLGDYFVALRLHSNRSTGEIQPIVLRYREPEPCIPIRLTAIATVPDLPITAYVLGPSFATPLNYSFIEPPEEPSLWIGSASYASLVGRAVDDAGGRAFVTDFAGDTPTLSLELPSIEHLRDVATPREVVQGLMAAGYMGDAQLLAVLTRAVPPPPGRNPQDYYNCLVSFFPCEPGDESYVADGWTASGAIDVIVESIVAPRERATALLARHPRTTRLFTTMSADEMTVDPVFRLDEGMAAVSHIRRATLVTECTPEHFLEEAPQRIELPSGRTQRVRPGRIDPRDDETICNASGGTLGTPPPPSCGADGGSSAGRDGSTAMDGGAGDPDRIKTSGGCNAAGPGRGGAQPLGGLGFLAVGLAILVSRIRSAMPRRRRPRA